MPGALAPGASVLTAQDAGLSCGRAWAPGGCRAVHSAGGLPHTGGDVPCTQSRGEPAALRFRGHARSQSPVSEAAVPAGSGVEGSRSRSRIPPRQA